MNSYELNESIRIQNTFLNLKCCMLKMERLTLYAVKPADNVLTLKTLDEL